MYARSREQYSLQLAWLLAAISGRIPEIDSFRDRAGFVRASAAFGSHNETMQRIRQRG